MSHYDYAVSKSVLIGTMELDDRQYYATLKIPGLVRWFLTKKAGYDHEDYKDTSAINSRLFAPVVGTNWNGDEMFLNLDSMLAETKNRQEKNKIINWRRATQADIYLLEQTLRNEAQRNRSGSGMIAFLDKQIEDDKKAGLGAHIRRQAGRKVGKVCTRRRCYNESCPKTGKLRKPDLLRRKWNYDRKHKRQLYHIVPLKKHNIGKRAMASNPKLLQWRRAVAAARARLGIRGFALIKKGTALYRLAKSIYREDDDGGAQPAGRPASSRSSKGVLPSRLRDFQVDLPVKRSRPPKAPLPRRSGRSNQGKLPARYLD